MPAKSGRRDRAGRRTSPPPADEPRDIPWSYGQDRVSAVPVDPDRLYAYWEVTDEGLGAARRALGAGESRLVLRIHDTTGRLFDGTNAHGHFDVEVDRADRQWFLAVGRPGSEAFVEVGLKAPDGRFAKIARSRRVDFPRGAPAPASEPEWMSVTATESGIRSVLRSDPRAPGRAGGETGGGAEGAPPNRALGGGQAGEQVTGARPAVGTHARSGAGGASEQVHRTYAGASERHGPPSARPGGQE